MTRSLIFQVFFLAAVLVRNSSAVQAPTGLVSRTGDQSVVVHWDKNSEPGVAGYNVYRSLTNGGAFVLLNTVGLVTSPGYCDFSASVINGRTNYYQVTAGITSSQESLPS